MTRLLFLSVVGLLLLAMAAPSQTLLAQTVAQQLDAPFSLLNWSETQTGILANRRAVLIDPRRYDGTASADTLTPYEWELLYGQLRSSAVDPALYPSPAQLATATRAQQQQGRLPIAVSFLRYDYIPDAALTDGRLEEDLSSGITKAYRPTVSAAQAQGTTTYGAAGSGSVYAAAAPYAQADLFSAGVRYDGPADAMLAGVVVAGSTVPLVVPSALFVVSPGVSRPSGVELDAGDGQGWRWMPLDVPVNVTYASAGRKTLSMRAGVAGAQRTARFEMRVSSSSTWPPISYFGFDPDYLYTQMCKARADSAVVGWSRVHCNVNPGSAYAWASPRNYEAVDNKYEGSYPARYDYAVKLAPGHTQITKPYIVVRGFDPTDGSGLRAVYNLVQGFGDEAKYGNFQAGDPRLDLELRARGYDIIAVRFHDSHDFVQRNALALVHLIRSIHAALPQGQPIEAIVGYSLGGLISRYALAHMETQTSTPHRVKLFVAYDSPQQGATVPIGLTLMNAHYANIARAGLGIADFWNLDGGLNDVYIKNMGSPGTQQLLSFWAGDDPTATSPEAVQTQIRRDLYADLLVRGDYPNLLRRVAVSNGNGRGVRQRNTALAGDTTGAFMLPGAQTMLVNPYSERWFVLRNSRILRIYNPVRRSTNFVYEAKARDCGLWCDTDVLYRARPYLHNEYDMVPGGYERAYGYARPHAGNTTASEAVGGFWGGLMWYAGTLTGWKLGLYLQVDAHRHTFIPTVSALDYNTLAIPRPDLVNSTFLAQDLDRPITSLPNYTLSPFDAYYTAGMYGDRPLYGDNNQFHQMQTPGIRTFILQQLALGIPDRTPPPPPSLSVTITGPSSLSYPYPGNRGTWTASRTGGTAPFAYAWRYQFPCAGGGELRLSGADKKVGGSTNRESCGVWSSGPATQSMTMTLSQSALLEATVSDAAGVSVVAQQYVSVGSGGALAQQSGVEGLVDAPVPEATEVYGLSPNPSQASTLVGYALAEALPVRVHVYDVLGRVVKSYAPGVQGAGYYRLPVEGVGPGVYLVRVEVGPQQHTLRWVVR